MTPLLFVAATVFLIGNALADPASRWPTAAVLAGIALGVPVYRLTVAKGDSPPA
ncbi:MAG: hypothetical protein MUF53_01540 [Gemmatimonadaceae bacterium]|nr:hypothetical protein [Gemmatimonadaceae bacterium]